MSKGGSERMSYGLSDVSGKTTPFHNHNQSWGSSSRGASASIRYVEDLKLRQSTRRSSSEYSAVRFLKSLRDKMSGALCCRVMSLHGRSRRGPSPKVSSSKPVVAVAVARSDFHRTEAIEDCIHFINSSSLKRSNTVAAISS